MDYVYDEFGELESQNNVADEQVINGCCDFLSSNEKKLFIDKFNQDYIVYIRKQVEKKKTLEKQFELLCDAVQINTIVSKYGTQYRVEGGAARLLTMVETLFAQQQQKQLKRQARKIAQMAQGKQNSNVR